MKSLQVPVHPGEILKHEFLDEMGLSAGMLARHIHVPRTRIERLVKEETSMTVDTATRLSKAFGTTVAFWINLQVNYDLLRNEPAEDISEIKPIIVGNAEFIHTVHPRIEPHTPCLFLGRFLVPKPGKDFLQLGKEFPHL